MKSIKEIMQDRNIAKLVDWDLHPFDAVTRYLEWGTNWSRGLDHAGLQLVLAVGGGSLLDHALVVAELTVEQKGVLPVEACVGHEKSTGG